MLAAIRRDLAAWKDKSFMWLRRNSVLKMSVMPKLLYLLHTVPIRLPVSFLREVRQEFLTFLWAGEGSRVSKDL